MLTVCSTMMLQNAYASYGVKRKVWKPISADHLGPLKKTIRVERNGTQPLRSMYNNPKQENTGPSYIERRRARHASCVRGAAPVECHVTRRLVEAIFAQFRAYRQLNKANSESLLAKLTCSQKKAQEQSAVWNTQATHKNGRIKELVAQSERLTLEISQAHASADNQKKEVIAAKTEIEKLIRTNEELRNTEDKNAKEISDMIQTKVATQELLLDYVRSRKQEDEIMNTKLEKLTKTNAELRQKCTNLTAINKLETEKFKVLQAEFEKLQRKITEDDEKMLAGGSSFYNILTSKISAILSPPAF